MDEDYKCRYETHENEPIMGFCVNQNCSKASQFCFKCILNIHQDHPNDCIRFNQLTLLLNKYIQDRNELITNYQDIQNQFKLEFEKNYKRIESDIKILKEMEQLMKNQSYIRVKEQIPFIKECYSKKKIDQHRSIIIELQKNVQAFKDLNQEKEKQPKIQEIKVLENQKKQDILNQQLTQEQMKQKAQESYNKGKQLYISGQLQEALAFFEESLKYDNNQHAWHQRIQIVIKMQQYVMMKLLGQIQILVQLSIIKEMHQRIQIVIKMQQYVMMKLLSQIQILVKLSIIKVNKFSDIYFNLGNALKNLNRYQDAIICYDEAIKLNPNFSEAFNNKGNALKNLNRYQDAIICYDEAIKLNPNFSEAFNNKGNALKNLNRYQDAIICYDEAIKLNPNFSEAFNNKGNALKNLNRYQDAIICYDEAIKLNPNYSEAFNNKGNALKNLNRYQDAIICYDQALSIVQKPLYMKNKGDALFALGNKEESKKWYMNALNAGFNKQQIQKELKKF
ncbi:unnamed protein product [Paramecium sonneborni]|uniref:Tetratricopeptide repeat protein n=1 Tax=Paramecium sonneborni TaxID=65129 RepID=A0A8S1RIG8_9CILI|nr:unnamed protein product [Paramecium sonneborni]